MSKNYFQVIRAGINTTFQDEGRKNLYHVGIPFSGAMDKRNYLLSNNVINKVFLDEGQNKYFFSIYWKKNKIWGATAKILIDLINLLKLKND